MADVVGFTRGGVGDRWGVYAVFGGAELVVGCVFLTESFVSAI